MPKHPTTAIYRKLYCQGPGALRLVAGASLGYCGHARVPQCAALHHARGKRGKGRRGEGDRSAVGCGCEAAGSELREVEVVGWGVLGRTDVMGTPCAVVPRGECGLCCGATRGMWLALQHFKPICAQNPRGPWHK
jgi:hypothetical protein